MSEENGDISLSAGPQGVSLSGKGRKVSEIIAILSAVAVALMAYMLHVHSATTEKNNDALATSIKDLARAQREFTCITYQQLKGQQPDLQFCKIQAIQ